MSRDKRATCERQSPTKCYSKTLVLPSLPGTLSINAAEFSRRTVIGFYNNLALVMKEVPSQSPERRVVCSQDLSDSDRPRLSCRDAGAVSAINFHIILRLNGQFFGLYTYTENDDNDYLQVCTWLLAAFMQYNHSPILQ